jgi:membrane-associated phospholipid phosphatase
MPRATASMTPSSSRRFCSFLDAMAARPVAALQDAVAAEAGRQHRRHPRLLSAVLLDHEERGPGLGAAAHRVRPADRVLAALLPVYLSLWGYIALPVLLAKDKRELWSFSFGCAAMTALALVVFWFMPTAIPNFTIDATPGTSLHFLKTVDSAGNAFPSLHVSFSVFACIVLARQLREVGAPAWLRLVNVAWAVAIVYSTMAVRQHVLIDVLGGLALGLALGFHRASAAWPRAVRARTA